MLPHPPPLGRLPYGLPPIGGKVRKGKASAASPHGSAANGRALPHGQELAALREGSGNGGMCAMARRRSLLPRKLSCGPLPWMAGVTPEAVFAGAATKWGKPATT